MPEYARPADGTYREHLRAGVVQALTLFVDHIADPRGRGDAIAATYYELGRGEALEGRSLDALQSALRVGGLHAWRLMGHTAEQLGLDSAVITALGEPRLPHRARGRGGRRGRVLRGTLAEH